MRPILILYRATSGNNVRGISTMIVRTMVILLVQQVAEADEISPI